MSQDGTATYTIDTYAPTAVPNTDPVNTASRSFTEIAPNAAAQSGIGDGPAAVSAGTVGVGRSIHSSA
jgi:hypothetical protein